MRFVLSLLAVFTCVSPLMAHTGNTGALAGRVTDPTGAVVPAAAVDVTSVATGEKRHVTTGTDGAFSMPLLPPGAYAVTVSKSGFSRAVFESIVVTVTETADVNVRLELGTETQSVEVASVAEVVQTDSSALGRVVSEHTVESLPLVARNYTQVIGLSPGVTANITNAGALGRGSGGLPRSRLRQVRVDDRDIRMQAAQQSRIGRMLVDRDDIAIAARLETRDQVLADQPGRPGDGDFRRHGS